MKSTRNLFALVLLGTLTFAATAVAQTVEEIDRQNFNVERFRLGIDRDSMTSIEWGNVPRHLAWDVGLWIGYADDPLVLYQPDSTGARQRIGSLVGSRLGGGIVGAISLFDWVQLGLEIPISLAQTRDDSILNGMFPIPQLTGTGLGDLRVIPKIRLLNERENGVGLAFVPMFSLPTSSKKHYFGDEDPTFSPMLAVSKQWEVVRVGANLGYTFKNEVTAADLEVTDEIFLNVGPGFTFDKVGIDVSLGLSTSAKNVFENANQAYAELLGAVKYDFGLAVPFVGAGIGLNRGYGTPDWRLLGGVRFNGGRAADRDNDGIADVDDKCPDEPEDKDRYEDLNGCPDPDNDNDKVLDINDGAPNDPEDIDDFEDSDGVPDPDNDNDGVLDIDDKCPLEKGPAENKGCPEVDTDGDGLMDGVDECPNDAEDKDQHKDEDGCPDPDNDGDGVLDAADNCVMKPGPVENRGCPDSDRDNDSVVDRQDNCPDEPGPKENFGCKKKQLVVISGDKLDILDKVYFKTNSATIRRRSYPLLLNVAAVLTSHPEIKLIEVQGHTDSVGSESSNLSLSQRRADSVRSFLMKQGLESNRLRAKGYGELDPIESNESREGRAANRRVEFKIVGGSRAVQGGDSRQIEVDQ